MFVVSSSNGLAFHLDDWLTGLKISTNAEIEKETTDYIYQERKIQVMNL